MTDRIVEVAGEGCRLRIGTGLLELTGETGEVLASVPVPEVSCLVLAHPRITLTHPVVAGVCGAGGLILFMDSNHRPVAWAVPVGRHSTLAERFRWQAEASRPLRKRLWQMIVRAKIAAQARTLREVRGDSYGLEGLIGLVRSGDSGNVEARAAQRYWPLVFGDTKFRRRREADDQNRFLNYGYVVLRAAVARAICATGLHPGLGIHHGNRYDEMPLADDLLEPFRPLVDRRVAEIVSEHGASAPLSGPIRGRILSLLLERHEAEGELRTPFDLLTGMTGSLVRSFQSGSPLLEIPAL